MRFESRFRDKRKKRNFGTYLYWLLIPVVMIIAILPALSAFDLPIPFKLYSVQTGSMKPTIKVGDIILVKEEDTYSKGDVITYIDRTNNTNIAITHRIEDVNSDGTFVTKGDFNSVIDVEPVQTENIVGKYYFRIPLLGYPLNFVRTVPGFILLIVIPAVIIIYEEIKKIKYELHIRKIKRQYS
jgi:signal peptidase I